MSIAPQIETDSLLQELLSARILVLDGAMGTMVQALKLDEAAIRGDRFAQHTKELKNFVDVLCLTHPQAVTDIHRAYLDAGSDIVLLECVPNEVGAAITEALEVPVIGIGAGPDVDGQILVLYDILDITQGRTPRFVRNFQQEHNSPLAAISAYVDAVRDRSYPAPEHCFS